MKQLVISRRIFPECLELLQTSFVVRHNQEDKLLTAEQLAERARDAEALFVVATDRCDQHFLSRLPQLKMLATGSVGTNHLDLKYCQANNIAVSFTPDVLTDATADMAWALLMSCARRVTESERWLRAGHWDRWAFEQFLGAPVSGTNIGIVGMGRIGAAIARRARGFDMKVLYHNRSVSPEADLLGANLVDKETILQESDFLVLVLPYSSTTHHWLDAASLKIMKKSACVINIARGGIVDDSALADALAARDIAGAGLDVFEAEPLVNAKLLALDNLVMTPHLGSATRPTRFAMAMLASQNLMAWANGKPLLTPVKQI
jgi:glyoxylate/hydroxypyruvate/2-ketogluconate reductase